MTNASQAILIVDDNEGARYARSRTLRRAGFNVIEATSGAEALRLVTAEHPRLVLLDIQLPDISGLEVCRRIKANAGTAVTPVLHMSATNVAAPDQVRGLEGGADGYLVEPVPPDVLVATVRALLRMRTAEDELRESRRQMAALVGNLPGMAYRRRHPGWEMTFVSEGVRELTGYDAATFVSGATSWLSIIHPEDRAVVDEAAAAARGGRPLEISYRIVAQGGATKWLWDRATPVYAAHASTPVPMGDADGVDAPIIAWEGFATDITERKRAQDALSRQQENLEEMVRQRTFELEQSHQRMRMSERMASIGTLSAGLGHDMGNLLLPVRVRLDTLQEIAVTPETQADVQAIRRSVDYLQRLANGLRLLSLDPHGADRSDETTDLSAWWADAEPLLRNALPSRVTLATSFAQGLPELMVSPSAFTQAIFNLVRNAGDAMKDQGSEAPDEARADEDARRIGGTVTIRAVQRADGHVQISVQDNGPGMTPEVKDRCLEPFFSTKPRVLSTGLGLALVTGIVRGAGGTIEIDSRVGEGSTFTLTFPVTSRACVVAEPRGAALVELRDKRMHSFVSSMLRSLRIEPTSAPVEGVAANGSESPAAHGTLGAAPTPGMFLWISDDPASVRERAPAFINGRRDRSVIVFGDTGGAVPPDERIAEIGPAPRAEVIRVALRQAMKRREPQGAGGAGSSA